MNLIDRQPKHSIERAWARGKEGAFISSLKQWETTKRRFLTSQRRLSNIKLTTHFRNRDDGTCLATYWYTRPLG